MKLEELIYKYQIESIYAERENNYGAQQAYDIVYNDLVHALAEFSIEHGITFSSRLIKEEIERIEQCQKAEVKFLNELNDTAKLPNDDLQNTSEENELSKQVELTENEIS